jgi:hypothetical protein
LTNHIIVFLFLVLNIRTSFGIYYYWYYNSTNTDLFTINGEDISYDLYDRSFFNAYLRFSFLRYFRLYIFTDYFIDDYNEQRDKIGNIYLKLIYRKNLYRLNIGEGMYFDFKGTAAYYKNPRADNKQTDVNEGRSGVSDLTSGISLYQYIWRQDLALNASIDFIYVPSKEWNKIEGNDTSQVLFKFGISYSF